MMDVRVPQRVPFDRVTTAHRTPGSQGHSPRGHSFRGQGRQQRLRLPRTPSPIQRGVTFIRKGDTRRKVAGRRHRRNQTHPDEMEGAPKIKQTTNLQKQIAAFEKLTEHANSKFSRDKLYEMLYMVSNGVPYLRGNKIQLDQAGDKGYITSIRQLRELHATINGRKRKGIQKEEEAVIMKFFETFFKDLQYLKNLKAYFDERIYCVLYEYFYDPLDISVHGAAVNQADDTPRDQDSDSGHSSQFSDEDKSPTTGTRQKHDQTAKSTPRTRFNINSIIHDISGGSSHMDENLPPEKQKEKEELIRSVHELYEVNRSWEAILTEDDLNIAFFDPDSYHEISRYKDAAKFELVLRLIPDIFTKCFKSVTLAKVWWDHAVKVYKEPNPETPADRERDFETRVTEIMNKVSRLGEDIVREEQQVIVYENDLRKLRKREKRAVDLNSETEKLEMRKEQAEKRYKEVVNEREQLKEALENTVQGTVKYNKIAMDLRSVEERMVEQHEECKLLEYHLDILKGDYNVEMEVRPSFMRFTDSLQDKIAGLRKSVGEKKVEKRKFEKTLVLMKTNREKMKEIMTKFVRTPTDVSTAATDETPPSDGASQPGSDDRSSTVGDSFFLTQDAQLSERSDKRTHAAVQQRLKVLYKDYDFDDRFRPSSVASDVTEAESSGNEADDETVSGLRGPYARPGQKGSRFTHMKPLGREEYILNSEKAQIAPSRIPRPAGVSKKS